MQFAIEPGELEILVGRASNDICLSGTVQLVGARRPVTEKVFRCEAEGNDHAEVRVELILDCSDLTG
jgi:hypothetical protein